MLISQCKQDAVDIAAIAASEISGEELLSVTSSSDDSYLHIHSQLSKYKRSELVTFIYAMTKEDDTLRFAVDTDEDDPAGVGETYEWLDSMTPAFEGTPCCDEEMTSDKWGTYLSAYAPVFNEDGSVVGIVGCDIIFSDIIATRKSVGNHIIILVLVFFAVLYITNRILSAGMVSRDILTEVYNYDTLINMGSSLKKNDKLKEYSAILANIKDFKYLNQKIGASAGDLVLKGFADHLSSASSHKGIIARTGNDNFAVLIKKDTEEEFIEKLRKVTLSIPVTGEMQDISLRLRCGIYSIEPEDTIREALNSVSMALKDSKASSESTFVRYDKGILEKMEQEKRIIADFPDAIEKRQFSVFYQPKVNVVTKCLCGAEALVRWIKDGRLIPPLSFIPILEQNGKIAELDFYVFETVCRNIREWINNGFEPVKVSSNFSKLHLADPDFADTILNLANKYSVPHEFIEIELTESSGYSDFEALTSFVERMNKAGISTSIDDFGTGYSSLSLLKDIDVDVVKLDKSFLRSKESDDASQQNRMLENVIRMINDLDKTVICEGVENDEQLRFLRSASCGIVQGFLFDKPLPHDEFEQRLINPIYSEENGIKDQ